MTSFMLTLPVICAMWILFYNSWKNGTPNYLEFRAAIMMLLLNIADIIFPQITFIYKAFFFIRWFISEMLSIAISTDE